MSLYGSVDILCVSPSRLFRFVYASSADMFLWAQFFPCCVLKQNSRPRPAGDRGPLHGEGKATGLSAPGAAVRRGRRRGEGEAVGGAPKRVLGRSPGDPGLPCYCLLLLYGLDTVVIVGRR